MKLHEIDDESDAKLYFMPLALLTTVGDSSIVSSLHGVETIPLNLGSVMATLGLDNLANFFSADFRSDFYIIN